MVHLLKSRVAVGKAQLLLVLATLQRRAPPGADGGAERLPGRPRGVPPRGGCLGAGSAGRPVAAAAAVHALRHAGPQPKPSPARACLHPLALFASRPSATGRDLVNICTSSGGHQCHLFLQAGAAWPKLKPFVLELLTTLVGKQVRASWRGRLLAWCVWQCVQRTLGMHGVSAISVHATVPASKAPQSRNKALHIAQCILSLLGKTSVLLRSAPAGLGHCPTLHSPHTKQASSPELMCLNISNHLPDDLCTGVEQQCAVEGVAAGGGAGGSTRLPGAAVAAAIGACQGSDGHAAGRCTATQGCLC
jgi:hypothetical protein